MNEIFEKEWYWVDTVNTIENYYFYIVKQQIVLDIKNNC